MWNTRYQVIIISFSAIDFRIQFYWEQDYCFCEFHSIKYMWRCKLKIKSTCKIEENVSLNGCELKWLFDDRTGASIHFIGISELNGFFSVLSVLFNSNSIDTPKSKKKEDWVRLVYVYIYKYAPRKRINIEKYQTERFKK